jgi:hypothetical protein
VQRLQLLESLTNDPSSMAPKEAMEALGQLASAIQQGLRQEWRPTQMPVIRSLLTSSSRACSFAPAGSVSCQALFLQGCHSLVFRLASFMSPPVISHSWDMLVIYGKVDTCGWEYSTDR